MAFFSLSVLAALVATATAASLLPVKDFGANGTNPAGLAMYIYVPDNVKPNAAVILSLHGCSGSPQMGFSMTGLSAKAAASNFIIIAPGTTKDKNCWDNHSEKSLLHENKGDSQSLANMVKYTITTYKTDPKKTFVTGFSSGGMMTNTMAATYPDLFAAGIANSGVTAGCLAGRGTSAPGRDERCAQGQLEASKTGEQYVQTVKAMYPGYTGSYPRMQFWHGKSDSLVRPANFNNELKQWGAIHGVSPSGNSSEPAGFTHVKYGDGSKVEGYLSSSGGHQPMYSGHLDIMLKFFGI